MNPRIADYLAKYAEPEATLSLSSLPVWDEAVVLPCYGENLILDRAIHSLSSAATQSGLKALVLVLINGNNISRKYGDENRALLARVSELELAAGPAEKSFLQPRGDIDVLYVDRTLNGDQPNQGVGWARKYGSDFILRLMAADKIRSPWISTTDADAQVEPDYFERTSVTRSAGLGNKVGVVVHPFLHEGAEDKSSPIGMYDTWLRYYESGLRSAGSPYAFPTIGSLLTFHADTYATVRGFPQKDAAEDFYFLSKAAKVSQVAMGGGLVRLACRPSSRVPFGTGVGVKKIEEKLEQGQGFGLYHPQTFSWLRLALEQAAHRLAHPPQDPPSLEIPEEIKTPLAQSGFFRAIEEASFRKTVKDRVRTFHSSWDAFQTLKFVHLVRDQVLGEIPYQAS
jgi:hypothetical protein